MFVEHRSALLSVLVQNKPRSRKLLRAYSEVVKYVQKKFATDYAIANYDAAILRFIQQTSVTPQKCAGDL